MNLGLWLLFGAAAATLDLLIVARKDGCIKLGHIALSIFLLIFGVFSLVAISLYHIVQWFVRHADRKLWEKK